MSKFRQNITISTSARDSRVRLARWQNGRTSKQSTEALQNLGRAQDIHVQTKEGKISPSGTQRRHSSTCQGGTTPSCLAEPTHLPGSFPPLSQHCNFSCPIHGDPEKMVKCTIFLGSQHFVVFNGLLWELLLLYSGGKSIIVFVAAVVVCPLLPEAGHELCA